MPSIVGCFCIVILNLSNKTSAQIPFLSDQLARILYDQPIAVQLDLLIGRIDEQAGIVRHDDQINYGLCIGLVVVLCCIRLNSAILCVIIGFLLLLPPLIAPPRALMRPNFRFIVFFAGHCVSLSSTKLYLMSFLCRIKSVCL